MKRIYSVVIVIIFSVVGYAQNTRLFLRDPKFSDVEGGWITPPAEDREYDRELFTVPKGYEVWMHKMYVINRPQYLFDEYKRGRISNDILQQGLKYYGIDTNQLSQNPLITHLSFAVAYKAGKMYFLIDQHHARKYDYIMQADSLNNGKSLLMKGFQLYYKGKIYSRNVLIKPMFNNGIYYSKNAEDSIRKYLIYYKHYRSAPLQIGTKKYELMIMPGGRDRFKFHEQNHEIYILPYKENADYNIYGLKRYMMLGDTCYINGYRIVLRSTDTLVNYIDISIRKQGKETPYSFEEGNYIRDNLHFNLYDSSYVSFFSKTNKPYILVDFWGSWCGPCIDNMPRMDSIIHKHTNILDVIGVQCEYDDNIAAHRRFKDSLGVSYYQIFQHLRNKQYGHLIEQMRVVLYPSYFLLNRKGKILFYGNSAKLPALGKLLDSLTPNIP